MSDYPKLLVADTLGDGFRTLRVQGEDASQWRVVSVRSRSAVRGLTPLIVGFTPAALMSRRLPRLIQELAPALQAGDSVLRNSVIPDASSPVLGPPSG